MFFSEKNCLHVFYEKIVYMFFSQKKIDIIIGLKIYYYIY